MRKVLLPVLLAVSMIGFARTQESAGNAAQRVKELTADAVKRVKAQILALEEEKVNCYSIVGQNAGWSATWIKWHFADGLVHVSDRLRSKAELMDELQSGIRKNIINRQYNRVYHIYGDGGDGTTVVMSATAPGGVMDVAGIRHTSTGVGSGLSIDIWYKQDGRWWIIAQCFGSGEPEPFSGEATVDDTPGRD
jgi:hypothetical protein